MTERTKAKRVIAEIIRQAGGKFICGAKPMDTPHETWLRCLVSPGMFDNETGVDGRQFDGSVFSLFVPADSVDHGDQQLTTEASTPGWVRVEEVSRKDNLVLVELPRQTFQNGAFITVKADQLQTRPERQKV